MLEWLKEMVMSRNVVALLLTVLLCVLVIKLIFNAGKVVVVGLGVLAIMMVIYFGFPEYWQSLIRALEQVPSP